MRVELRVGWQKPDANGESSLGVTVSENYGNDPTKDARVRADATSRRIAGLIREGLGDKLCEELAYVGYKITWKTKTVIKFSWHDKGHGTAEVDFKEKKSCPPEILSFGRKLVMMLKDSGDRCLPEESVES